MKYYTCLLLIMLKLPLNSWAQSEQHPALELSEAQTSQATQAIKLFNEKKYSEARNLLTTMLKGGEKVQLLELMGDAYYYDSDPLNGEKYYQRILRIMTTEEEAGYSHNIRQKHAWALEALGDSGAVAEFKRSLDHPVSRTKAIDFWYAGNYFTKKNLPNDAYSAYLAVVLLDPTADQARAKLDSLKDLVYSRKQIPFNRMTDGQFAFFKDTVLSLGNPEGWITRFKHQRPEAVSRTLHQYIDFADSLKAQGLITLKPDYQYWAFRIAFGLFFYHNTIGNQRIGEKTGDEFEQSIYYAAELSQLDTIETKPVLFQQGFYQTLMDSYMNLDDLYHTTDTWKKLREIDQDPSITDSARQNDNTYVVKILRTAFDNVSFDLKTGELRDWDFDDFAGRISLNKQSKNKSQFNKNIPPGKYKSLIDCNCYPYGIVSSSEDYANTGTEILFVNNVAFSFSRKTHADTMSTVMHEYFPGSNQKDSTMHRNQMLTEYKTDRYANRVKYISELIDENNFEQPLKEALFRLKNYYDLKYKNYGLKDEGAKKQMTNQMLVAIYKKLQSQIKKIQLAEPNLIESYYVLKNAFPSELLKEE